MPTRIVILSNGTISTSFLPSSPFSPKRELWAHLIWILFCYSESILNGKQYFAVSCFSVWSLISLILQLAWFRIIPITSISTLLKQQSILLRNKIKKNKNKNVKRNLYKFPWKSRTSFLCSSLLQRKHWFSCIQNEIIKIIEN